MANINTISMMPFDAAQAEIERRRRMAQMLQEQAMAPLESQVAPGGMVVPTSPVLGLAKLLQTYIGAKTSRDVEQQAGELSKRSTAEAQDFLRSLAPGAQQPMSPDAALAASLSATPTESQPMGLPQRQQAIMGAALSANPQMRMAAQLAQSMQPQRRLQFGKIDYDKFTPESIAAAMQADDPTLLVPVSKPADVPSIVQEYEYAKSQGFSGSLMDYQTALRKAGATNVTTSYGAPVSGVDAQGNPVFFQPDRGGGAPAIIPGVRPEAKAPNKEQADAAGFAARLEAADKVLRETPFKPTIGTSIRSSLPFSNQFMGQQQQMVEQAKREFITAQLRRESGASISPGEFDTADKQYFPQPGDSPAVIAQKEQSRQRAVANMLRSAGPNAGASAPAAGAADAIPAGAVRRVR